MTEEKIKIESEFANAAYKDFISIRYGLTPCCYYDLQSIRIKRDACNWEELKKIQYDISCSINNLATELGVCFETELGETLLIE
jgi:hypothetical protein